MMPSLVWNMSDPYKWAAAVIFGNGGSLRFNGPWMTSYLFEVVTGSPENLEYILKNNFPNFPRGPYFKSIFFDIFGDGLFTADEELWKHQRRAVSVLFSGKSFRDYTSNLIQKMVQERLLPVLEDACKKQSCLDLQDVLLRFTFDNVCAAVLGKDSGCLAVGLPEVPFAKAFDEAIEACVYRLILPPPMWKLMRYFNMGMERKHRRALRIIHEFASEIVESRKTEINCGANNMNDNQRFDVLSTFIKLEADKGRPPSDKFLRDLCLSVILAGRDTSSLALAWFFWLLSKHPNVEQKILEELHEVLEVYNKSGSGAAWTHFTNDDFKDMHNLQAALSESMRLFPPVPLSYRQVMENDILPDGTPVNRGSKLLYVIYATNRMEKIWGKDAHEFKPDRWIRNGICMKESDYNYPVFNAGPRLCLGKDMAYLTMKSVAANILLHYHVCVDPGHPVEPKFGLTLFMKHGLLVTLHPREDGLVRVA
eukprot:Gb_27408 [translate_table: standard]